MITNFFLYIKILVTGLFFSQKTQHLISFDLLLFSLICGLNW